MIELNLVVVCPLSLCPVVVGPLASWLMWMLQRPYICTPLGVGVLSNQVASCLVIRRLPVPAEPTTRRANKPAGRIFRQLYHRRAYLTPRTPLDPRPPARGETNDTGPRPPPQIAPPLAIVHLGGYPWFVILCRNCSPFWG